MAGMIWTLVRTAASNIPWGRVVQSAPAVVELVERVKERFVLAARYDLHEEVELLREENVKLAEGILRTSEQMEVLTKALEVVIARQKMMTGVTVISTLIAISSLVAWLVR